MSLANTLEASRRAANDLLSKLQSPLLLFFRLYVGWVFFSSGLWKINNWEQNLTDGPGGFRLVFNGQDFSTKSDKYS